LIKKNVKGEDFDFLNKKSDYIPLEINKLCYSKLNMLDAETNSTFKDFESFQHRILFMNQVVFQMKPEKETLSILEKLVEQDSTDVYASDLAFVKALLILKQGKTNLALEELFKLQYEIPSKASVYLYAMGLICLKNYQYRLAAQYFDQSYEFKNQISWVMREFATSLAEKPNVNMQEWQTFLNSSDAFERDLAKVMVNLSQERPDIQDPLFSLWLSFYEDKFSIDEINNMINQITDVEQKRFSVKLLLGKWSQEDNRFRINKLKVDDFLLSDSKIMFSKLEALSIDQLDKLKNEQATGFAKDFLQVYNKFKGQKDTSGILIAIDTLKNYVAFETTFIDFCINYNNSQNQTLKAYEVAKDVVTSNPYHIFALKQFCFLALSNGLEEYANDGKKSLEKIMNPLQFKEFNEEFERTKIAYDKVIAWE
ncbi:MAG: hypothetical protein SNJ77_10550, partial [Cytophagales bacterium]